MSNSSKSTMLRLSAIAAGILVTTITCRSQAGPVGPYAVSKKFDVDGMGNVRIEWHNHVLGPVAIDPQTHRLYLTRTCDTAVFDGTTGKLLADMPDMNRARGVALVPRVGRGFVSDDGIAVVPRADGRGQVEVPHGACVHVFDLKTNAVIGKVATDEGAGSITYDPFGDRVWVACTAGGRGVLVPILPDTDLKPAKSEASVEVGGIPTALVVDGAGHAFVNLFDKEAVAVVDLKEMKVRSRFPVAPGAGPMGLAIDPAKHYLFVSCRNQRLVILGAEDGHVLASFVIGARTGLNTACAFDAGTGNIFAAGDELTIVKETSPGKFQVMQKLGLTGGMFMALDTGSHFLYFPATHFLPQGPKSDIVVVSPLVR